MLSTKLLSIGSAAQSEYWIATLGGTGSDSFYRVAVDSSGNLYAVGATTSQSAGDNDILICKYDSFGSIQWQRRLGGSGTEEGLGIAVDSSANVYVGGYTTSQGAGTEDCLFAKYDTSGVLQWQRSLGGSGSEVVNNVAVDSSGNLYIIGYTTSQGAGSLDFLIAKYNSSGTIQWQRSLGGSGVENGLGITVDSSANVYVTGLTTSAGAGSQDLLISKYNSSGTIQWQRVLGGIENEAGYQIAVASSGNIYVAGDTASQGAGSKDMLICQYDSSGTIQWQRSLGGSGGDYCYSVALDSSENVYVCGFTDSQGAGSFDGVIAKYNSSGTIQWQRRLGGTGNEYFWGIAIDSSENICVVGSTSSQGAGGSDALIAKFPSDGSLTGTYGNLTYAAATLTDASRTLTAATSTLTDSARTLTDSARTLTDAATTLTSTVTAI